MHTVVFAKSGLDSINLESHTPKNLTLGIYQENRLKFIWTLTPAAASELRFQAQNALSGDRTRFEDEPDRSDYLNHRLLIIATRRGDEVFVDVAGQTIDDDGFVAEAVFSLSNWHALIRALDLFLNSR